MQTLHKDLKIGDIVSRSYRAARVFKKHEIDFCCGGGISLEKACSLKKIDADALISELEQEITKSSDESINFGSWTIPLLISYIKETHHKYVRANVNELLAFSSKVAWRHGDTHPENIKIHETFSALVPELLEHLESEETRVFPLIEQLSTEIEASGTASAGLVEQLRTEFDAMEEEHDSAGDAMKTIRRLSHQFTPPEGACTTYQVLYRSLQEFEEDLHKHVHLENNILFSKAKLMLPVS